VGFRDNPDFRFGVGYHFGVKTGATNSHPRPRRH
jgi:hypothetical protein